MNSAPVPPPAGAQLTAVAGGTAPDAVAALTTALRRVLAGAPEVLVPHAPRQDGAAALTALRDRLALPVPPGTAVVLRTSGSTTGLGHLVALSADSLAASARATEQRLAGPGQWLLAVPTHHVAGLQVLVRSVLAGTAPVVLDTSEGFTPEALAEAARDLRDDVPGYLSLVPTQLVRVLAAGATAPLARLEAILVGGAALPPRVLERARDAGLRVVTTYGMTETGGGCVYDGVALPGVSVRLAEEDRIEISGPVLASGYLDDAAAHARTFVARGGERWLRTSDRGALTALPDGTRRLTVLGRVDDAINTGGIKVAPAAVERVLGEQPGIAEAVVVGVPDAEWGQLVAAVVTAPPGTAPPSLADVRAFVTDRLGAAHAPRALLTLDALPLRGPGKVDRRAAARLAAAALAEPGRAGVQRHGGGR
ncbi:o-succinylbenzoate--CoA ligase [Georgenia sp. AZ-5]|uniref:o-succinylbenzoate--CoA ligase n=1 Tax=Georgenia sp. AZ-5 TaxID=3367526 RepID=UPI003754EC27